jgi:alpha-ketoglutarate-dependent dioxygenase FTO
MTKKRKRKDKSSSKSKSDVKGSKNQDEIKSSSLDAASSLAQRLKKHRGVAANTPPPPIYTHPSRKTFLTPHDDTKTFKECLDTSYKGFCYDSPSELPIQLHQQFESSFHGMDDLFLYDTIQPGKKRLTRTSVTRTLVGDPGSTYKYLGLRLFSHPWVDVDENGNATSNTKKPGSTLRNIGYPSKIAAALIEMGRANDYLRERSNELLEKDVSPNVVPAGLVGSAEYNLTLVNKMDSSATKRDLKIESSYGMGKVSVGWHRDSGLKDFSSIAVYQSLHGVKDSKACDGWGVALRAMDGGAGSALASVPALCVPLPSGSLYYMLDDFNHNHEHAVIAGSDGVRYSSTHRVAREGQGTWQYIRDKTDQFLVLAAGVDFNTGIVSKNSEGSTPSAKRQKDKFVSIVRSQQMLMSEIEFEWLRQWFVQGHKVSILAVSMHI